jgi:hypothetical protein
MPIFIHFRKNFQFTPSSVKFLDYRRVAATATLRIFLWKTFQNKYQTKNLTKSTGCWNRHRFELSTSLVCTNSRSMKNAKYPPSSFVQHAEQVTVHGSAWFCKGFVLCSAQKKRNKKETPPLSNCCKVGYWLGLSVVSLQCL